MIRTVFWVYFVQDMNKWGNEDRFLTDFEVPAVIWPIFYVYSVSFLVTEGKSYTNVSIMTKKVN